MKRLIGFVFSILAFTVTAQPAFGQDLTQAERDFLVSHLEKTRATLEQATKGLSPAQLSFKPTVLRWSIAQCVEHIALSEDFIFNLITERVMKAPALATPKEPEQTAEADRTMLKNITDRSARFQAPEPVRPKHPTGTTQELLSRFAASRNKTIEFVRSTKGLRSHCVDSAFGKCVDAYQWLLLISAHSERHTAQLLEVKADPNFPKK